MFGWMRASKLRLPDSTAAQTRSFFAIASSIAGNVLKDLEKEPLGQGKSGPVFLKDIWPTSAEIHDLLKYACDPAVFTRLYGDFTKDNPMWA